MKDLIEILTWCRGAGTGSESMFVQEHIATIPGIWADEYGNYHLTIGQAPKILWSSHTDTVTRKEGRQNVKWIGKGILGLNNGQAGQCLGADDGAGVWLMMELIKADRPGHYVFHRDEEIGGLGSTWISQNAYVLPDTIQCAIAMDRCSTRDIITHQGFQRTASDEFTRSLGDMLVTGMVPDDTGVFTDTANYTDIIPECTNLSVGYERNHGAMETLDTNFLRNLRDKLLTVEESNLVIKRIAGDTEYADYYGHSSYYGGRGTHSYPSTQTGQVNTHGDPAWGYDDDGDWVPEGASVDGSPLDEVLEGSMNWSEMVSAAPDVAGRLLEELGVTRDEFRAHVFAIKGRLLG